MLVCYEWLQSIYGTTDLDAFTLWHYWNIIEHFWLYYWHINYIDFDNDVFVLFTFGLLYPTIMIYKQIVTWILFVITVAE